MWIPETTRFDADAGRLGGRESATFTLSCPQFRLLEGEVRGPGPVAAGLHGDGPAPAAEGGEPFARVNYFFWRYLRWQEQLRVLVEADVLPETPEAPSVQTVAHLALERARSERKLGSLWDRIMVFVPEEKKEPNPFIIHNN